MHQKISVTVHATSCAICGKHGNATEMYPANFSLEAFSPAVFSARRLPDRIHYRIVRCDKCGLVRSDPVAESSMISQLYSQSTFEYGREVENLAITYGAYLSRLDHFGIAKDALLEIGCGNGFFLAEARRQGYCEVRGVEPSKAAIESAPGDIRSRIVCSMMSHSLFPDETFDVICLFQVLDHIFDPVDLLQTCNRVLKPGGFVLCLNHNVEALSVRLMKSHSPIIDIEHTYLYSPATMAQLFSRSGFEVKASGHAYNRYSLSYLVRLVPFPLKLKEWLLRVGEETSVGRFSCWVPLGNLYAIAQKRLSGADS